MEQTNKEQVQDTEEYFDLKAAAGDLDEDEEKNLAEFLKKVAAACQSDSSVPSEVGAQVSQWLKEMEQENAGDDLQADLGGS